MCSVSYSSQGKPRCLGGIFGFKSGEGNADGLLEGNEETELGGGPQC